MKNTFLSPSITSYFLAFAIYLYFFIYNGIIHWCKVRPHYGRFSTPPVGEHAGFYLCLYERTVTSYWHFVHYGTILYILLTIFLIMRKAESKMILVTYGLGFGVFFLILFLMSFIVIH